MDFIDACKVILRRWYVAVPLLVLTLAGTYFAYSTASANYSAKGSIILLQPASRVTADGAGAVCPTNPWCAGGDSISLANVAARRMDDPTIKSEVLDPHPGAAYEVILNADNRSSILEISATARTPKDALDTLHDVTAEVRQHPRRAPENADVPTACPVDARDLVRTDAVTTATRPSPQAGGKLRAAAAAFSLGIAITLGGVFLAESMAVSRRAKASLLDRIALPDQPAGGSTERTTARHSRGRRHRRGRVEPGADPNRSRPVSPGRVASARSPLRRYPCRPASRTRREAPRRVGPRT